MTACRKERAVDELYNATRIVMKPEITPVLGGSHRMQGPVNETDHDIQKNMVSSKCIKEFGKHSMSWKVHMRGESGACNVCSAPCSSCMHLNRALMGSKADDFSDETCRVNAASQYSVNVGDTSSSFKSKACDSLQQTTSETSNLLSFNSSHDSLSENAESKAPIRSSDTSDAVEGFEMLTNTYEDSKVVEVNDDNISCISRANDASLAVNNHNRNVERKDLSCSLASVGSIGTEEFGKAHKSVVSEMVKAADSGNSAAKGKLPEFCGHVDSSLKKESASDIVTGQKFVPHKSLGLSTKICPKTEVDDGQDPKDDVLKCFDHGEQDVKPSELVEGADMQQLQSLSGDDSDESDIVEHDVKVCDICGDAGREDMLAMCSRCSDGAEHIYCMRKMLRRVPKGQWLCEECKFAEETDNQKQGSDMEGRRPDKAVLSTQFSNKRLAENIEFAPTAKRQALEIRVGSPKPSSPKRMGALSRESSFKSVDRDRLRSAYQTSQSTNDISETARSPSSGIRIQTAKGTLSKSNSFNALNSKAKVKLVDDVVPQKQKGSKEHASLDMKERPVPRMMGKSVSFKSASSGRPNVSESKVKMLSSKFSHVPDLKGLKQAKERGTVERKNLSKLDRPLASMTTASPVSTPKSDSASRGETSLFSSVINNREPKVVLPDGKLSIFSKSMSLTRKGGETQIASVGGSSTNGMSSSASEQKSNQVSSKDEPLSGYSLTVEKPRCNVDGTLEDVLPLSGEMTNQADKYRESSVRCRPTVTGSQKCKEIGHNAEFCRTDISQASGTDASAPRSSREEMQRGNRLKDALHAALLRKPEIYRKKRGFNQSDELSTSNMDLSYEVASEGSHDGQTIIGTSTSDFYKNTNVNNLKQLTVQPIDSVFPSKVADSVYVVPSLGKPTVKDLHSHASVAMSVLVKTTAIPEYEYIWKGSFELQRGANFLDLCGGFQAHLSTCASPKVLEVVRKFPHKVSLNEVPRLSVWPSQFHQSGAKEDNIALYFFAKDLESYERHYKILLDAMIKNDLALKGNFDGVELLIFPSNRLPERSQRWNMLFFLWGVFRTMRVHCLDFTKETCVPSLSNSLDKDTPTVGMTLSENVCIPKHIDESSASDRSCDVASASNAPMHVGPTVSKDRGGKDTYPEEVHSGSKVNLLVQDSRLDSNKTNNAGLSGVEYATPCLQEICLQDSRLGTEIKSSVPTTGSNSSNKGEKRQVHWVTSTDREDVDSLKSRPVSSEDVAIAESIGEETILGRKKRAGIPGGVEEVILDRVNINSELNRDYGYNETEAALLRDLTARVNSRQSNNRKHPDIPHSETTASVATSQEMPWNEVNSTQIDGESDSKRIKIGSSGLYGGSTSRGTNAVGDGFVSHNDLGPCSLVEEKRCVEACEEKVIPEDLGATERYFFPVDSRHVQHFMTDENSRPWKDFSSGNVDKSRDGFPSLELALGAETKPQNKGILPFFVGSADEKDSQDKPLDAVIDEKDDDVSASLSLSLSFPFPDEEQPVKPVSKSEQLLPESHHVNTSLLLFGRYPDK